MSPFKLTPSPGKRRDRLLRLRLRRLGGAGGLRTVTADTRMVATLKPTFPFIIDLASLP